MPSNSIRLSRVSPANLHPHSSRIDRPEPSPAISSLSRESDDIEEYIGSGTDTAGGRTPVFDKRLSFAYEDTSSNGGSPRIRHHLNPDVYGSEDEEMDSKGHRSGQPLLSQPDEERGRARYNHSRTPSPLQDTPPPRRPALSRRSTMRSRSPDTQAKMAAKKKYVYAAVFLVVSLVSFCIQTELASYVQQDLGWNKAYCMLYLTHGSWSMLWPAQLLYLRLTKWKMPWQAFWRQHVYLIRSTTQMIRSQELDVPRHVTNTSPWPYLIKTTAFITSALTIAGLSWYLAVDMTTPSDLTAIYNCSAFFAYAFSVPLLKEKLRLDKSFAVVVAIVGVMVVAYGDSKDEGEGETKEHTAGTQFLGNLIIGAGSVLYGLYEVLYKRWACPPEGVSAGRGMIFANTFGSCIGLFTLTALWIPLPILHMLGWETFELPTGETAWYLWVSVVMNATFAGSFLVLISLTSPVLSSVAALLTIFIVAIVDWMRTGKSMSFAAISGCAMIVVAFVMLSWSTYREMVEDAERKAAAGNVEAEWDSDSDEDDRLD
ncbi:putative EamA domain-containing protein [Seiridium cardinale]|uniref:EamA domain-containing protein n=1 Tax=Seiridium cardinale TaxID=138064 RepID=A0ABR2Y894_9PEZI